MSPTTLLAVLVAVTLVGIIAQVAAGETYVCPVCGSRSVDSHNSECPWGSQ
jgi:hypothetical protein